MVEQRQKDRWFFVLDGRFLLTQSHLMFSLQPIYCLWYIKIYVQRNHLKWVPCNIANYYAYILQKYTIVPNNHNKVEIVAHQTSCNISVELWYAVYDI